MSLSIKNLSVNVQESEIIHDISFVINPGEVHVLMGPNGSGKSTLANTLAGHPKYAVSVGSIMINDIDITTAKPHERVKNGLLLSMQHTPAIEGVSVTQMLRVAKQSLTGNQLNPVTFHKELVEKAKALAIDPSFLTRSVNVGFSGGEKKKLELLQIAVLDPQYIILDETDSGLDIDALKLVTEMISTLKQQGKGMLVITHYTELLDTVDVDVVHVMMNGRIVESGNRELIKKVKEKGFSAFSVQ